MNSGIKGKILLSLFTGVSFGFFGYLVCSFLIPEIAVAISVFGGALFALLIFIALFVSQKRLDDKYAMVEKRIASPVWYRSNGNFHIYNGKIRNCNIYLCERGIMIIGVDEKPNIFEELLLDDILKYSFEITTLRIYMKNQGEYYITLADSEEMKKAMLEKGWIKE